MILEVHVRTTGRRKKRCRHDGINSPILPCLSILPAIPAHGTPSMTSDLEQLARWRTVGARHSQEVYDLGLKVLKSGGAGDQGELLVCFVDG